MLNFHDIKPGDHVIVNFDGYRKRGEVTEINTDDKQARVYNGVQEFWYELHQIEPLPVNDEELERLKFHRSVMDNGNVKYAKGAFRMIIPKDGDFGRSEVWYRDETRKLDHPITLNQLQNHFYEMTKVHLTEDSFD